MVRICLTAGYSRLNQRLIHNILLHLPKALGLSLQSGTIEIRRSRRRGVSFICKISPSRGKFMSLRPGPATRRFARRNDCGTQAVRVPDSLSRSRLLVCRAYMRHAPAPPTDEGCSVTHAHAPFLLLRAGLDHPGNVD